LGVYAFSLRLCAVRYGKNSVTRATRKQKSAFFFNGKPPTTLSVFQSGLERVFRRDPKRCRNVSVNVKASGISSSRVAPAVHALLLLALSPVLSAQLPAGANSPIASQDPTTLDRIWQKASEPYDQRRVEIMRRVDRQASDGLFRPEWQSLAGYQVPDWYKDAKFGIFIHWGLYSVPAFGSEQYPRQMYIVDSKEYRHHLAIYGSPTKFGYKDFIPMFTAEHYDPEAWVHLFKLSGAKYVVPVFEHHDGFAMYDSDLSDWTAVKMGPHRDLAGDLAKAVRAAGLHLGASSHRIEHDWFMYPGRKIESDVNDPLLAGFYGPAHVELALDEEADNFLEDWTYMSPQFASDWLARNAEIVEKYHPELFYFDFWIGHPELRPYLARFAAFFYNETSRQDSQGVINYKLDAMHPKSGVLDIERGVLGSIAPEYWQTDTSISNKSWGYIKDDAFKTPDFIVHELIDIVSKNGNLLLNIGPRADGTIPDEVQQILLEVGRWLKTNGDAIYGTHPWNVFGEGPTKVAVGPTYDTKTSPYTAEDFRFTCKGGDLYLIEMAWPSDHEAVIRSLGSRKPGETRKIESIVLLGSGTNLQFQQRPDSLHIQLPDEAPGKYAYVFRIRFQRSDESSGFERK
jgi:alpha-L-fucosidase